MSYSRVISKIMMMAVIAAPVPPPTIAPMPTIAKAGTSMGKGETWAQTPPNAAPSVAPI